LESQVSKNRETWSTPVFYSVGRVRPGHPSTRIKNELQHLSMNKWPLPYPIGTSFWEVGMVFDSHFKDISLRAEQGCMREFGPVEWLLEGA